MEFFSGIKKAYENFEQELSHAVLPGSKTDDATDSSHDPAGERSTDQVVPAAGDDGWGSWGEEESDGLGREPKSASAASDQAFSTPLQAAAVNKPLETSSVGSKTTLPPSQTDSTLSGAKKPGSKGMVLRKLTSPNKSSSDASATETKSGGMATQQKGKNCLANQRPDTNGHAGKQTLADGPAEKTEANAAAPSTPGRGIDSMSREDLIKLVRKQVQVLKSTKAKCAELSKNCSHLEEENVQLQSSADASDLKEKLSTISGVRDQLAEQLREAMTERDKLQQDCEVSRLELGGLMASKNEVERQLRSIAMERDDLRSTVERLQQQSSDGAKELERRLEASINECQKLRACIREVEEKSEERLSQLEAERDRLGMQLSEVREDLDQERTTAREKELSSGEEIEALHSRLAEAEKHCTDSDGREKKLRTDLEEVTTNHQAEMQSVRTRHEEQMKQLREELEEVQSSRSDEVSEVRIQLSEAETSRAQLDSRVESLMATVSDLERSRDALQAQLQSAAGESDSVTETLSRQNAELEEQLSLLRSTTNRELEQWKAELHKAKTNAAVSQERCESLEKDVDRLTSKSQEALSECDEARAEVEKLQALSQEAALQQSTVQSLSEEHEHKVSKLCEEHESAMKEIASRHAENMNQLLVEKEKLAAEVKELEHQGSNMADAEELHRQLDEAKAEVERLARDTERTSQLESNLSDARQQIVEFNNRLRQVQSTTDAAMAGEELVTRLRSDLQKSEAERINLSSAVANLQKELDAVRANHEKESAHLNLTHEGTKAELKERDAEVSELRAKLIAGCKLESELERMRDNVRDNGQLQMELDNLKGVVDGQNDSLAERDHEIEELRSVLQRLQNVHSSTVDDLSVVRGQLQQAGESGARQAELEKEVVELQCRLEQLEAKKGNDESSEVELKSKLDSAEQEHAKLQERFGKLRAVMVKLKGENTSLKSQLESSAESNGDAKKVRAELQSIQQDKTRLQLRLEEVEKKCGEQEEKLRLATSECQALRKKCQAEEEQALLHSSALSELRSEMDGIIKERSQLKEHIQRLQSSKSSVEDALRSEQAAVASDRSRVSQLTNEVENLKAQLLSEQEQHDDKTRKLETALKEAKKTDLMHLELADYERTITSLEERVEEKERSLAETTQLLEKQEAIVEAFKKEVAAVEQQRSRADDHVKKLKELLVKSKKELAEAHKQETVFQTREAELRGQLEVATQASESEKVEASELAGEVAKYQQQLQLAMESQRRTELVMEQRLSSVQAELTSAQNALIGVQAEYETYKVRVHSVLKQQKQKPAAEDNTTSLKETCDRHAAEAGRLRKELQDVTDALSVVQQERDDLEEEVQQLTEQYKTFSDECRQRDTDQKTRYDKLHAEYVSVELERTETIRQLGIQSETLTTTFKEQLHSMQQEHRSRLEIAQQQVDSLQEQLSSVRLQLADAEERKGSVTEHGPPPAAVVRPQPPHRAVVRPLTLTRFPAESKPPPASVNEWEELSDWSDVGDAAHHQPVQRDTVVTSLEKLLSSAATPADDATEISSVVDAETTHLGRKLKSSSRQVQHLTELLNESEANAMRLTEQASILKEEIRRLERNQARQADLANLEYLKNVIIKFLHADSKGQKDLIPVLTDLLKLSPQEQKYINDICKGQPVDNAPKAVPEFAQAAFQHAGQFANYMHRWTGL